MPDRAHPAPPPLRTPLERALPVVATLRAYTFRKARGDLVAGLTVALFTIPQAMAYALIAGLAPITGIFAAIAASILGAVFGSSEFLINGPTNAISVVLAANMVGFAATGHPHRMVFVLTLLIGLFQLGAAFARVGAFTRFVSEPVLTGFTAGAGIYIAINQIPSLLGLEKSHLSGAISLFGWTPPSNCLFDLARVGASLGHVNTNALMLGLGTFLFVRLLAALEPRIGRRLPGPFVAVLLFSGLAYLLDLGDPALGADKVKVVQDIQSIRRNLPGIDFLRFSIEDVGALLGPALAIGTLGAVEAIAIGKSLASVAKHPFDANRQLIGEGFCNLGAAFTGGFASSGSFSRTAVNFDAGAVTRMSCVFSGGLILVVVMLFAPAANHIPIPVLAGTLIHIGLKLVNAAKVRLALQATISDRIVLLTTFLGVLLIPSLQYALFAGIGVSVVLALRRAEGFRLVLLDHGEDGELMERPLTVDPKARVIAVDLQGELFFATAESLEKRLCAILDGGPPFLVLRMMQAYNLDVTCAEALIHVAEHARERGGRLVLTGVRDGMYETIARAGLLAHVGKEAVFRAEAALLGSTYKGLAFAHDLAESDDGPPSPAHAPA
jgi:SulP family sulfate permease